MKASFVMMALTMALCVQPIMTNAAGESETAEHTRPDDAIVDVESSFQFGDLLPGADTSVVVTPRGSESYRLPLHEPKKHSTGDPVWIRGDIYLWWVSRDAAGEISHSYTPLPGVSIRVYDVYGRPIETTIAGVTKKTYEQVEPTGTEVTHEYAFVLSLDEPRPLVLIFDIDASIEMQTHNGVQIDDTFVPVVAWIAGLSTGIPTTLSIAVPTAGQLFATGGLQAIRDQLDLLRDVLASNEEAAMLWEETNKRVTSASCGFASLVEVPCG